MLMMVCATWISVCHLVQTHTLWEQSEQPIPNYMVPNKEINMTTSKYLLFTQALIYASTKHHGQVRKGTDIPYITHPVAVAEILSRYDCTPDVVYAGLLHDVIEDTQVTQSELTEQFGANIAALVIAVSETKTEANKRIAWEVRKLHQLQILEDSGAEVAQLKAADVLHNLTTIVMDMELSGDEVWQRFNANKNKQLWYYSTLISVLIDKLGDHRLSMELQNVLTRLLHTSALSSEDMAAIDREVRTEAANQDLR
jgi:(p)ppGpp synthase/HD superfamily hydrolase